MKHESRKLQANQKTSIQVLCIINKLLILIQINDCLLDQLRVPPKKLKSYKTEVVAYAGTRK